MRGDKKGLAGPSGVCAVGFGDFRNSSCAGVKTNECGGEHFGFITDLGTHRTTHCKMFLRLRFEIRGSLMCYLFTILDLQSAFALLLLEKGGQSGTTVTPRHGTL